MAEFAVLLVDDHPASVSLLDEIFNHWGIKLVSVNTCESVLKMIKTTDFDLIIIDYYLREKNGFELAEEIIAKHKSRKKPEIVLLSPSKSNIDLLKLKRTEKYDFLTKPLLQSALKQYLKDKFGDTTLKQDPTTDTSETPSSSSQPLHILVAEDQIINRKIVVQLLEKRGWIVELAENGKVAMDKALEKQYDLILMDVQMPEMDGFDATRNIRKFEQDKDFHTPIVAMTAHAMKGDREKCLAAGMDYYIAKPVNPVELYDTIEKFALMHT